MEGRCNRKCLQKMQRTWSKVSNRRLSRKQSVSTVCCFDCELSSAAFLDAPKDLASGQASKDNAGWCVLGSPVTNQSLLKHKRRKPLLEVLQGFGFEPASPLLAAPNCSNHPHTYSKAKLSLPSQVGPSFSPGTRDISMEPQHAAAVQSRVWRFTPFHHALWIGDFSSHA